MSCPPAVLANFGDQQNRPGPLTVFKDVGLGSKDVGLGLLSSAGTRDRTQHRTPRPTTSTERLIVTNQWSTTTTTAPAFGRRPRLGTRPDLDQTGPMGAQVRAVIADYDQVRTWSDPSARQRELTRIGADAVDLLRRLGGEPR